MIACNKVKIGGFPGTIRTNDGVDISLLNFEGDMIDRPEFSKFFGYPLSLKKHAIFPLID
jgi:hypothetical protein